MSILPVTWLHPSNACAPILVKLSGNFNTPPKPVHEAKAESPIISKAGCLPGSITNENPYKEVQFSKAESPMYFKSLSNEILPVNVLISLNAPPAIPIVLLRNVKPAFPTLLVILPKHHWAYWLCSKLVPFEYKIPFLQYVELFNPVHPKKGKTPTSFNVYGKFT